MEVVLIQFILGGTKSGKSAFALQQLQGCPGPWAFVATGKCRDMAFRKQIADHKQERSADIAVWEADLNLVEILQKLRLTGASVLVDSLDFWLFSLLEGRKAYERTMAYTELVEELTFWKEQEILLVSTEMGLGPLAFNGEVRAFARELGTVNQRVAAVSSSMYLIVAGVRQQLK